LARFILRHMNGVSVIHIPKIGKPKPMVIVAVLVMIAAFIILFAAVRQ